MNLLVPASKARQLRNASKPRQRAAHVGTTPTVRNKLPEVAGGGGNFVLEAS
jgi:hypothetical protein